MNLARCKKGHYYDEDKYIGCPHCAQKDNIAKSTVRMSDNVDSEQTLQNRNVQGKALKDAVLEAIDKKRESEVEQVRGKRSCNSTLFPVGILVETNGCRMGEVHVLEMGCNYLGVCDGEFTVSVDIEQVLEVNATITYHEERQMFVMKPLGSDVMVQVGRMMLRENIMLRPYDKIMVKDEILLFVPICGEQFKWT